MVRRMARSQRIIGGEAVSRIVYHYYASYQDRPGELTELDGFVIVPPLEATDAAYASLKALIASTASDCDPKRLTIKSLSLLGPESSGSTVTCKQT